MIGFLFFSGVYLIAPSLQPVPRMVAGAVCLVLAVVLYLMGGRVL